MAEIWAFLKSGAFAFEGCPTGAISNRCLKCYRCPVNNSLKQRLAVMAVTATKNPIAEFKKWLAQAEAGESVNPNAMALATATPAGRPSVRMVLLKDVDEKGFVFYTNGESQKGVELAANMEASLCFYWKSLARQVRIDGSVELVGDEEADAYFKTRDRGAQIGAWASQQSRPTEDRFALEKNVAKFAAKFHVGPIPRPGFWCGYRVIPRTIEFWVQRPSRLHDRWLYHKAEDGWTMETLYP
jgi:pyridoxamine 5'-phosphate oxidase